MRSVIFPLPARTAPIFIVYEPAEKGYKDWNEQLLAKIRLQNQFTKSRPEEKNPNRNGKHVSTDDNAVPT